MSYANVGPVKVMAASPTTTPLPTPLDFKPMPLTLSQSLDQIIQTLRDQHLTLHKQILERNSLAESQIHISKIKEGASVESLKTASPSPQKKEVLEPLLKIYETVNTLFNEKVKGADLNNLMTSYHFSKIISLCKGEVEKTQKVFEETKALRKEGIAKRKKNDSLTFDVSQVIEKELSQFEEESKRKLEDCLALTKSLSTAFFNR